MKQRYRILCAGKEASELMPAFLDCQPDASPVGSGAENLIAGGGSRMNRIAPVWGGLFLMLVMCLSVAAQQPGPLAGNIPAAPLVPAVEAPAKPTKNLLQTFHDGGPLMY